MSLQANGLLHNVDPSLVPSSNCGFSALRRLNPPPQPAKTGQRLCGGPSASPVMLRVGLRHVTGNVTGQMHKIPRVYRGPYGFTGQMTPGSVYPPFCPEFGFDSPTRPPRMNHRRIGWDGGSSAGADYHLFGALGYHSRKRSTGWKMWVITRVETLGYSQMSPPGQAG